LGGGERERERERGRYREHEWMEIVMNGREGITCSCESFIAGVLKWRREVM
jgi:hypothetical protein